MGILIQNAKIMGGAGSFKAADVAVSDDGIIEKVSSSIRPSSSHERVDASGHVLLPGLVNAHTHAAMSLLRGVGDDLQLFEWLRTCMWPREAKMDGRSILLGTRLALCEMIRSGTTCFNDMYFNMDLVAQATEEAGLRATLGYSMIDRAKSGEGVAFDFEGKGRKELAIAETFAKKIQKKKNPLITSSIAPHAPHTCSKELLEASAKLAGKLGCVLHVHAAETRKELAEVLALTKKGSAARRPIDYLDSCGCLTSRTVLAHGVYASKSEVKLVSSRSSSVAHCPVSNLKLAGGGAAPVPEFLAAGANLSLGTDGAASNNSLDLFQSMKVGAIEQKNFRFDASAVKAEDYLRMATEGGAKALGIRAGKIEKGYLADLVLLDARSPNLVPFSSNAGWLVYSAGPQNVTDVMVQGKWLMRGRKLLTLDEEKIMAEAQKRAEKLG
ncbi:5'-deoxyadenosine deaminase [uncultured archaeon]|nr:5'-deoxyadenosine deaminase [uncultured archaeon]